MIYSKFHKENNSILDISFKGKISDYAYSVTNLTSIVAFCLNIISLEYKQQLMQDENIWLDKLNRHMADWEMII